MRVLFMCVANSARSQMAEGLAKDLLGNDAEIESAGSAPGKLNPYAVKAMQEIGIDISRNYSKDVDRLTPKFLAGLDYVITLCADEVCPTTVTKGKRLHWPVTDPAGHEGSEEEQLKRFRTARDAMKEKLEKLKAEVSK